MGARILLVEDNPANLLLMEYLLRAFGHVTISATDGAAGVETATREMPDLILMDLQMPRLNGFEAMRLIKAIPSLRAAPVIAVTAIAMVGDRDKVLAQGFDGYIAKPLTPETFVAQVEAFIRTADQREPSSPTAEIHPRSNSRRRILVVDNSATNIALARSILEPFGYEVVPAGTVREAFELARRECPDLILSDVHMPEGNGYDLLHLVRDDPALKAVPFVFISSTVWGESERSFGIRQGADAFILRPIEPDALVAELARHVKAARAHG